MTGPQLKINSTIQDLIPVLERIAAAIETSAKPPSSEGFFDYGEKVYSNLSKGNGDGWYTLEGDAATTQPPVFRGQLVSISFPLVKRREQEVRKFHLVMRANGKTVVFESGYDCFFSKTVLAAFAAVSPGVLGHIIQLATYSKELRTGDKTLAVSLRSADGTKLPSEWSNDDDWSAIATAAVANVNVAVASREL